MKELLYCPKCQVLTNDKTCPSCGGKKLRVPEPEDPALLITAGEVKAKMIETAFDEHDIPYEERICGFGGPPRCFAGQSANISKNIFVPFSQLETCEELLNGSGILEPADAKLQDKQISDDEPEDRKMSSRKRFLWRVASAVLFILVVWGVVVVADYAANALKAFLSHG